MRVEGLRSAVAILIACSGVGLAVGSANAETAAVAELKAPDSADSAARDATRTARKWWGDARAVLFDGIQLSPEQSREVDATIATQLEREGRFAELQAELRNAEKNKRWKRVRTLKEERAGFGTKSSERHGCIEQMRALLSEEQRPGFDMNRARLVAKGQGAAKGQKPGRRGRGREMVEARAQRQRELGAQGRRQVERRRELGLDQMEPAAEGQKPRKGRRQKEARAGAEVKAE